MYVCSETKKRYYRARLEYDAAVSKLQNLNGPAGYRDPARIDEAEKELNAAEKAFEEAHGLVWMYLQSVEAHKDYQLLEWHVEFMRTQRK